MESLLKLTTIFCLIKKATNGSYFLAITKKVGSKKACNEMLEIAVKTNKLDLY
jgi:hypothetical protein